VTGGCLCFLDGNPFVFAEIRFLLTVAGKWRAERETPCVSNLRMMGTSRLSNEERRLRQVRRRTESGVLEISDFHEPWGKENASPHARDLRAGSPRPLTAHSALGATGDAPYGLSRRTTSEAKLAVQPPLEWRAAEQPYPDCAE